MSEETVGNQPLVSNGKPPFELTRRTALKSFFAFIGAFGLGSFFYGLYRFLAPDARAYASVELPLEAVPPGSSYSFQYGGSPCLLVHREDERWSAFILVCTHLACTVNWNPEKKVFHCPCHDGLFDSEGNVISGPPPGPLERLKVEVKGDRAIVSAA